MLYAIVIGIAICTCLLEVVIVLKGISGELRRIRAALETLARNS